MNQLLEQPRCRAEHRTMSGSLMRLKNEPIAVNMSVLVKLVSKPSSASSPNSRGCDDRWTASAGKAQTCAPRPPVSYVCPCRKLILGASAQLDSQGR